MYTGGENIQDDGEHVGLATYQSVLTYERPITPQEEMGGEKVVGYENQTRSMENDGEDDKMCQNCYDATR